MKYTEVKNPQWDKEKKSINCIVNFDSLGELPFSASADDITQHGLEIYNRCIAGDFGPCEGLQWCVCILEF